MGTWVLGVGSGSGYRVAMKNVFGFANRAECTTEGRRWVQGSTNQQMRQFHCLEIKGTGE